MFPLFEFLIDKEANFVYWAQLLVGKWSWYFEKENSNLFSNEAGLFSDSEKDALDKFRIILQRENNQYQWLWKRYDNLSFNDAEEEKDFLLIREKLEEKFNIFWDKELPHLNNWKNKLEQYNFPNLDDAFKKISATLGVKKNSKKENLHVRVKLFISGEFPTGATRSDFDDLTILNVSRVPSTGINRVVGVIVHEFSHLINTKSGFLKSLIKSSIFPSKEPSEGYQWDYLITETILKSISSGRANTYIGSFLVFSDSERRQDENLSHQKPLSSYSYEFLIRIAASRILQDVTGYLNNKKTIDNNLVELTIKTLSDLVKERMLNKK